jgi:dTDP-4-dehydrorhamnose 3,5-epimerase-like enzyme
LSDPLIAFPLDLQTIADERGLLTVLEINKQINFDVKRIYFLSKIQNYVIRGAHAHRELSQIFICVSGSFDLCIDNGSQRVVEHLTESDKAYFLPRGNWRELKNFTEDAICLVLADRSFEPDDYIHSYDEFINWVQDVR